MKTPRATILEQIVWHIEHDEDTYYGNKEQFVKRKKVALTWLKELIGKE